MSNPNHPEPSQTSDYIAQIHVAQFNLDSVALQTSVGVDPAECLRLVEADTDRRTPIAQMLGGVVNQEVITPARGTWRKHDEERHFQRIRELGPDLVSVIVEGAELAHQLLADGEQDQAKTIGTNLDFVLADYADLSEEGLLFLLRATVAGNRKLTAMVPSTARQLMREQKNHERAIRQAQRELGIGVATEQPRVSAEVAVLAFAQDPSLN